MFTSRSCEVVKPSSLFTRNTYRKQIQFFTFLVSCFRIPPSFILQMGYFASFPQLFVASYPRKVTTPAQAEKSHHHVRHAFSYIVGIWRYETWQVGFAVGGILGCGASKTAASFAGIFLSLLLFWEGYIN